MARSHFILCGFKRFGNAPIMGGRYGWLDHKRNARVTFVGPSFSEPGMASMIAGLEQ